MEIRLIKPSLSKYIYWCLAGLLVLIYIIIRAKKGGDFDVYLTASTLLSNKDNIYRVVLPGLQYYYSPLFAVLIHPFSYLPFFIPELLWLMLNVFFLYRIWVIISQFLGIDSFESREKNLIFLLALGMSLRFLLYNFDMIQINIFLLYASIESIYLFSQNRTWAGALLLALAINIKILPLPLIPYLIYRGKFKAALFTILFFTAFLYLPGVIIGFDYNSYLLAEWWNVINPFKMDNLIEERNGTHSLIALIPVLLTDTTGDFPFKRNFVNLDLATVFLILKICQLTLIVLTFYFLRTFPFKKAMNSIHTCWELAYILLVIPLIFPHQQKYAFFYIFPSLVYVLTFLVYQKKNNFNYFSYQKYKSVIALLVLVFALTTLTTDGVIGRYFCDITQHYRIVTYGTLLLIVPLSICKPAYVHRLNPEKN